MALTCQQIVTRACTDAGLPNYTTQAGDKLNLLLAELAELHDWDILRSPLTIAVSAGPTALGGANGYASYALPQDYLRARKWYYYINGQQFDVNMIPLEQWVQLFQGPGNQTYPSWGASDLSPLQNNPATPPILNLWPTPAQAITLQGIYFKQPPDYTTPATSSAVPWFPYQNFLVKRLTAEMMASSGDKRRGELMAECQAFLDNYDKLANDPEGYAITIGKDARRFRGGANDASPTKSLPL